MAANVLTFHDGQAYLEAKLSEPYPVKVMSDVQSRNVIMSTGQKSVLTTATQIVPENAYRRSIKITQVTGTQDIYLGNSTSVSSTTGDLFSNAKYSTVTLFTKGPIFGIAITGAQTVSFMEEEYEA